MDKTSCGVRLQARCNPPTFVVAEKEVKSSGQMLRRLLSPLSPKLLTSLSRLDLRWPPAHSGARQFLSPRKPH